MTAPRPQPLGLPLLAGQVAVEQRLSCGHRPACLRVAAHAAWPAFTCRGCSAYGPMPRPQLDDELGALARFGAVLAQLPDLPDPVVARPGTITTADAGDLAVEVAPLGDGVALAQPAEVAG